ncbi:MAG: DUF4250 domain-containing protein [Verrucomicrobiales bacterium]|nr:DUF4250 domain-containing protein [Verrucomicrobiales bacterium]
MDPNLLPGLINTALRNDFESLDDLVKTHDLDKAALLERLQEIGYEYRDEINQVRTMPHP